MREGRAVEGGDGSAVLQDREPAAAARAEGHLGHHLVRIGGGAGHQPVDPLGREPQRHALRWRVRRPQVPARGRENALVVLHVGVDSEDDDGGGRGGSSVVGGDDAETANGNEARGPADGHARGAVEQPGGER